MIRELYDSVTENLDFMTAFLLMLVADTLAVYLDRVTVIVLLVCGAALFHLGKYAIPDLVIKIKAAHALSLEGSR